MSDMSDNTAVLGILKKNEYTGFNIQPYLFEPVESHYITPLERITTLNLTSFETLPEGALDLFNLSELLDPKTIIKRFSKKKVAAKEFFEQNHNLIEEVIRPYLDKKFDEIINILSDFKIPLYVAESLPHLYESDRIQIENLKARTVLKFDRNSEGTTYTLEAFYEKRKINLQDQNNLLLTFEPCYLMSNKRIIGFDKTVNGKLLTPFFTKEHIQIPKRLENNYFSTFIRKIVNTSEIASSGFDVQDIVLKPTAHISLELDWQSNYCLVLSFKYGEKRILLSDPVRNFTDLTSSDQGFIFYKAKRNNSFEEKKKNLLLSFGLKQFDNYFRLNNGNREDKPFYLIEWLINNKEELLINGFVISQNTTKQYFTDKFSIEQKVDTANDWFDLHINISIGSFIIPFSLFKDHILKSNREYVLPDGNIFILPEEWFDQYRELFIHSVPTGQYLKLNKHHFSLLKPFGFKEIEKFDHIFDTDDQALPSLTNVTLRSYQITGYRWMLNLSNLGFGGILADDMGLGKTLQTIAVLANYYKESNYQEVTLSQKENINVIALKSTKENTIPLNNQLDLFSSPQPLQENKPVKQHKEFKEPLPSSLLVMPSSLIHNWVNELNRFAPFLKVFVYTGSGRKQSKSLLRKYNLILTTYGTLRNDIDFLSEYAFSFIVLDESQQIKNPESKTARAAFNLQGNYRFALSGTPVENNLTDLWSQMNFVNPGLLGDIPIFNSCYSQPISKDPEGQEATRLSAMIMPFILRRTKESVAPELPDLSETISYCTMSEGQKSLYESEKSKVRNLVFELMEKENGSSISSMVLKALMQLRQIANHPKMIDVESIIESGKFDEVTDKLQTIIAEDHRVLIFSSFVKHLHIIEDYCKANGFDYSILTGSSINRGKIISEFKTNQSTHIFLISLKAGGVGLNLTEADYVFILDPWWNPAAEMQAINRAHRIGQFKNVFVYRFITKDTIEEKILILQQKKKVLADTFIKPQNAILSMSKEEIMQLFE